VRDSILNKTNACIKKTSAPLGIANDKKTVCITLRTHCIACAVDFMFSFNVFPSLHLYVNTGF